MLLCIRFLVYCVDDKASSVQLQAKQAAFLSNAAMVEAHNRDASQSYKMELNRFSDWTQVTLPPLPEDQLKRFTELSLCHCEDCTSTNSLKLCPGDIRLLKTESPQ